METSFLKSGGEINMCKQKFKPFFLPFYVFFPLKFPFLFFGPAEKGGARQPAPPPAYAPGYDKRLMFTAELAVS